MAAVDSVRIARDLRRHGAVVKPVASESALELVGEPTLEWGCGKPVTSTLTGGAEHVELSGEDLLLVAPATANTVAKMAHGVADGGLTAVAAAFPAEKIVVAPSMHLELYGSGAFRENLKTLRERGVRSIPPEVSESAAKLPPAQEITSYVKRQLRENDIPIRVVVTGGATAEPVDDIRIVTTRASGRTGVALAREAYERGADVTLVHGKGAEEPPRWVESIEVGTAEEMTDATVEALQGADVLISSAAISDHSMKPAEGKLPGDEPAELEMRPVEKLVDIAMERFPDLRVVAFKAESGVDDDELLQSAREKLDEGADLVVANDVSRDGAGFGSEGNEVMIVDGGSEKIRASKAEIAKLVLDRLEE